MPELPEVQTVVNTIRPHVLGREITAVHLQRGDIVSPAGTNLKGFLQGRIICDLHRRAKRIVFTLDTGHRFYIHLGMTGNLFIAVAETPIEKHTHLLIDLNDGQIRFHDPRRFGGIFWLGCQPDDEKIGPEPLGMRADELAKRLAKTARPIKNALLDQSLIAGLGNIYVDESLFAAQIHPLTPANKLTRPQIVRLKRAIQKILRRAISHRGSSVRNYRDGNGQSGNFQNLHNVYHRTGKSCPCCKTPIQKIVLGGRSTHFCPQCQTPPRSPLLSGKLNHFTGKSR